MVALTLDKCRRKQQRWSPCNHKTSKKKSAERSAKKSIDRRMGEGQCKLSHIERLWDYPRGIIITPKVITKQTQRPRNSKDAQDRCTTI